MNYIIEIKGEDKINSAVVIAKAKRAIKYCEVASNWAQWQMDTNHGNMSSSHLKKY